jgi:hypothetical protein
MTKFKPSISEPRKIAARQVQQVILTAKKILSSSTENICDVKNLPQV